MDISKLYVVLQVLSISIILLAFPVAARKLVETASTQRFNHDSMERELFAFDDSTGYDHDSMERELFAFDDSTGYALQDYYGGDHPE